MALLSIGAAQVLMMLVALGRAKILSVLLGPGGYGVVATVDQTVVSLVQLGGLSLPLAAMKFMARGHSEGEPAFRTAFATFLRAITMLSLCAVAAALALLFLFPTIFGADVAAIRGYFFIALLAVPATMLNILFVHTLAAAQKNAASAWLNMLVLLALAVAAVVGVLIGGIGGLYVGSVTMGIVASVVTLQYLRARLSVPVLSGGSGLRDALRRQPEILRYSLLLYSALASYSLMMLATRYFVFNELGAAGAGLLQSLIGVALTLAAVPNAVSTLYLAPHVNRLAPSQEKVASANEFARGVLLFLAAAGVGVALFPQLVLTLLFSPEFATAAPALVAFVLWQCLHQALNVYSQVLIGIDDVAGYAVITGAGYVAAALLFPTLVVRFGLAGAGLALSAGMLGALFAVVLRLRVRAAATMSGDVLLRTVATIGFIVTAYMFFDLESESRPEGIVARVGYALVAAAVLGLMLSRAERKRLLALFRRREPR